MSNNNGVNMLEGDVGISREWDNVLMLCHDDNRLFCEIMDVLSNHLERLSKERMERNRLVTRIIKV